MSKEIINKERINGYIDPKVNKSLNRYVYEIQLKEINRGVPKNKRTTKISIIEDAIRGHLSQVACE